MSNEIVEPLNELSRIKVKIHLANPYGGVGDHILLFAHLLPVAPPVNAANLLLDEIVRSSLKRNVNIV